MTENELNIVGHSLGVNVFHAKSSKLKKDKKLPKEFYRNRYCANERHHNFSILISLVETGIMTKEVKFGQCVFFVTDDGMEQFKDQSTKEVTNAK